MFRLDGSECLDELPSRGRKTGSAAAFSADRTLYERLLGEIVHRFHGIPGGLVGEADRLCRSGDRVGLSDAGEQIHPALAGERAGSHLNR